MKTASVSYAKNNLPRLLKAANTQNIVVMNHGEPAAMIIGIDGFAISDLAQMDDSMTNLISVLSARASKERPWEGQTMEEIEAEIAAEKKRSRKPARAKAVRSRKKAA